MAAGGRTATFTENGASIGSVAFSPDRRTLAIGGPPDLLNEEYAFERMAASGAEVVQEPTDQPYGIRDCAFRDPAGNLVRISEAR